MGSERGTEFALKNPGFASMCYYDVLCRPLFGIEWLKKKSVQLLCPYHDLSVERK